MESYNYWWKIGIEGHPNRSIQFKRPLEVGSVLVDLFDGKKYLIQTVTSVGNENKEFQQIPDKMIQTWPAGTVSKNDLAQLREKHNYVEATANRPFETVAIA